MQNRILIKNGSVLLPHGIRETDIEIQEGVIHDIREKIVSTESSTVIDTKGKYVLPGFIDIHTNGIGGFDLTNGVYDPESGKFDSSEEAYLLGLDSALRDYARTGVTRAILTSLASPVPDLKRVFSSVSSYRHNGGGTAWKEVLEGLFVEGTFMKLVAYRGAHNHDYFKKPSEQLFMELQTAAGGLIRIVNVVPEWGRPAFELIKSLSAQNIVCAAGHTGASGFEYDQAIRSGTRLAVHFLNGPTGSSTKPFDGGGAVENVLRADDMSVEIIADGYHVDKSYVMDTMKRKGFERVVVITDSMFPTALSGVQSFMVLGVEGRVSESGKYLQIADRDNALFGSVLTMDVAFSNVLNWITTPIEGVWYKLHEPLNFEEAMIRTSAMCSGNPARVLGIFEPNTEADGKKTDYTGSIELGKCADLVIADIERVKDKYKLEIDKVFVKGRMV